jgi:hypothetical protein
MSEDDLIALLEKEEANCISSTSGALAEQRREAMQYYYGQPYGDEVEGRSQVVTTEVKDAVEGILPSLMAIFTSAEEIVRFEPQNQEDEAAAQQATDYINYIFTRLNNGFLTLYCLFKDALLQKNGYAKVYWEEYSDQGIETYTDITAMELALMLQRANGELEVVEVEGDGEVFSKAVLRRTRNGGKICVDPVPPEEVLISRDTPNDLSKARFVEHRTLRTISEIRQMGFDIPDDIADFSSSDVSMERAERNRFDDADAYTNKDDSPDPATRKVWLCEAYLFVDFDEDGIAEYRKVTKVGKTLLDNVEFDSLPVVGGSAILMPHKHYGLSIHDLVKDIQRIKSTVTRQLLDNAYVANNGRMVVLDGMVNMDDVLNVRPNGIIRSKAMNAVQRLDNPLLGAPFYQLLEYFDQVKVNRVGARDFGDAVDPNALNAKAHTAELVSNASQERINLMARILAEGPVKAIFWKILELVSKHQQKPQMVKLRGQWVQVDPREWKDRFNMTVTVGLGTGSKQAVLNNVNAIAGLMMGMVQAGYGRLVSEQNAYHLGHTAAKALFPKDADLFFSNPQMLPPPQPQPNPDLLKIELAKYKADMGDAQKRDKMQLDGFMEQMRQKLEADKVQFQAMVDSALKDKDHHIDLAKHAMEMAQVNRQMVVDKLSEIQKAADQGDHEKKLAVLQGQIDALLEKQKQMHEEVLQAKELAAAEREHEVVERDAKGKVKKAVSRPKKKQ